MMPRIDLRFETDQDKVDRLISDITKAFSFGVIRFDLKLTIWRWDYFMDKPGFTEKRKETIAIGKENRHSLYFECEGTSGRLRGEDLSEEAFEVLLSVCDHPRRFRVSVEYLYDIVFLDISDIR